MNAYGDAPTSYDADQQYLLLLKVFYYVFAGVQALYGLVLVFQLFMLRSMERTMPPHLSNELGYAPHATPFTAISIFMFVILGLTVAMILCNLMTAHSLGMRRNYVFCLVIAGFNCLLFPIGTALGVFTIVVLLRPSVTQLFGRDGY